MGVLLPQLNVWLSLSIRVLLLVGYCAGMWHARVLSAEDRLAIRQFIRSRWLTLVATK